MGIRDLLPVGLYSNHRAAAPAAPPMVPSAAEAPAARKIEMYSSEFYTACAIGGALSCGLTHAAVTPMDVVKCNMQIDPKRFPSIGKGFSLVVAEQGVAGLLKGWLPTLVGYGFQGTCKFGFYEYFKKCAPCGASARHSAARSDAPPCAGCIPTSRVPRWRPSTRRPSSWRGRLPPSSSRTSRFALGRPSRCALAAISRGWAAARALAPGRRSSVQRWAFGQLSRRPGFATGNMRVSRCAI